MMNKRIFANSNDLRANDLPQLLVSCYIRGGRAIHSRESIEARVKGSPKVLTAVPLGEGDSRG